ncbi:MAG: S1 RNA-binding domain-containing protein, partial [Deltaproteobacteria bacterium]
RKIKHPSKILSEGDTVDAVVLNLDTAAKRISLGMKQTEPNPWDTVEQKYPVGTKIRGKIRNITDFGIFIGLDEGIDGLVHVSDISWNPRFKNPSELFKKNDEVDAVVLAIDKENERFSLGIKQLQPDPWKTIPERYKPGTIVEGTVINTTDFGIFLKIEEGLEGLVHISELPTDDPDFKQPRIGDKLQAAVLDVNARDRKIRLSVTKARSGEAEMMQEYLEDGRSTLGEVLRSSGIRLTPQPKESASDAPTQERIPEKKATPESDASKSSEQPAEKREDAEASGETSQDAEPSGGTSDTPAEASETP